MRAISVLALVAIAAGCATETGNPVVSEPTEPAAVVTIPSEWTVIDGAWYAETATDTVQVTGNKTVVPVADTGSVVNVVVGVRSESAAFPRALPDSGVTVTRIYDGTNAWLCRRTVKAMPCDTIAVFW